MHPLHRVHQSFQCGLLIQPDPEIRNFLTVLAVLVVLEIPGQRILLNLYYLLDREVP